MFGVVAFVQVPIVHLSVLWWRSLHQPPTVLRPGDPTIDHAMLAALLLNLAAFTVLFALLLVIRIRIARVEQEVEAVARSDRAPLAGAAVTAPPLSGLGSQGTGSGG